MNERVSDTFAYGATRKNLVSTLRVATSLKIRFSVLAFYYDNHVIVFAPPFLIFDLIR